MNATEMDPSGALMLVSAHTEGCLKTQRESENQQSRPQENTENTGAENTGVQANWILCQVNDAELKTG
jgi:hypothetical protein